MNRASRQPSSPLRAPGRVAVAVLFFLAGAAWGAPAFENPHGDLSIGCQECHTTEGWEPLRSPLEFDHATVGRPLDGGHRSVDCQSCHAELDFSFVGSACADCHLDPHQAELGFDCASCHDTFGWDARSTLRELHDATFPLTGAHLAVDCAACHAEDPPFEFQLTPTECFLCHVEDYRSADPDHVASGFSTDCESCHTTDAFSPATFAGVDHDLFFPLRGAHAVLDCSECHADGFEGTPSDCFACHVDDYQSTRDPDHVALGFPTMCESCHGTTTWEGATEVEHDQFFPLNGVHAVLDCESCHADGFEGTPTDCYSCHREDYEATVDPDHAAQGFSTDCESCHGESNWNVDEIDHEPFFPLRGAHRVLDCESCHAEGFAGTPTDCFECHQEDYEATDDPDHVAEGFPTSCEDCHNENNWDDAEVDHSFFPLTGAHAPLDCESCHADGFEGTPTDCAACHIDDYNQTDDPDHQEAGFPTSCEDCHTTANWDSDFDHDFWPLTGQHRTLDCESCHADGFPGTRTECSGCHLDDYNATTDPDHEAAGFPTTCEDCHDTNDWEDADFDHDSLFFPIYTGSHAGEWQECTDCHVQPNDFGVFECIFCHEHNQAEMDDEHEDVGGYMYESQACLACHPNGEE